ncbi:hypothetical protein GQ457_18G006910 [Hibiscus cannabinus]
MQMTWQQQPNYFCNDQGDFYDDYSFGDMPWNETLAEYKKKNDETIQNLTSSMRNLEIHIGHITNSLNNKPQGTLPSDTDDARQKRKEQCQVVIPWMSAGEPKEVDKEEAKVDDAKPLSDARQQSDVTTLTKLVESSFDNPILVKQACIIVDILNVLKDTNEIECYADKPMEFILAENLYLIAME